VSKTICSGVIHKETPSADPVSSETWSARLARLAHLHLMVELIVLGKALRQRVSPACPVIGETCFARLARLVHHHIACGGDGRVSFANRGVSLVRAANYNR